MSTSAKRLSKPSVNVSVPPRQREAFFQALVTLRAQQDDPLMSASAIIVQAIIQHAAECPSAQAAPPVEVVRD